MGSHRLWPALVSLLLLPACDKSPTPAEPSAKTQQPPSSATADLEQAAAQRPFEVAQAFFELNTTFHDMGFQVFLDDVAWKHVSLTDPQGNTLFGIHAEGSLGRLGITELHFESEEPAPSEVRPLFSNGRYTFHGETLDGVRLESEVNVTKNMPPGPSFTPRDGQLVDRAHTVVKWQVTGAHQIEVIIEQDELGHSLDVLLSGSTTRLAVPPQFLRPGREYKIEVQAIAESGNRTIAESTFRTRQ
jgi:hypothetical protein